MIASTSRLGDAYLYVIAPVAIFSALVIWIAMTLMTARHRWSRRTPSGPRGMPNRGPVQGGIIRGSPSQRNRRDPAPSATRREAAHYVEAAREDEAQWSRQAPAQGDEPRASRTRGGRRRRSRR